MPRNKQRMEFGRQQAEFATFTVPMIEFYAFSRLFCLYSGLYTKTFQGNIKEYLYSLKSLLKRIHSFLAVHPNVFKSLKDNL